MLRKSQVLKQNIEYIVFNWIKFYFWHKKEIRESFNETLWYFKTMNYAEKDMTDEQIRQYIINYILSLKFEYMIDLFIKKLKFTYIKRSFKDLMQDAELYFKNKYELQTFICNKIIPEISK